MKSGRVVAGVCAALVLDVPNQALQHVGGFDVRAIIDRMHLDAELVLPLGRS
jgi:acetoacetate decarboxylase